MKRLIAIIFVLAIALSSPAWALEVQPHDHERLQLKHDGLGPHDNYLDPALRWGLSKTTADTLFAWYDRSVQGYEGDDSTWPNIINRNADFYQGTQANQSTLTRRNSRLKRVGYFDGNDYFRVENFLTDTDPSSDPTDSYFFNTTSSAQINMPGISPVLSTYAGTGRKIIITDSASKSVFCYAGAAAAAISYGSEDYTENDAVAIATESGVTNTWDTYGTPDVFEAQSGVTSDGTWAFHLHYNVTPLNAARIYYDLNSILTAGKAYRLQYDVRHVGSGDTWNIGLGPTNSAPGTGTVAVTNTDVTFATQTVYFRHGTDTRYLICRENSASNDGGVYLDKITITPVDDFGTDALLAYSDSVLTTRGFGGDTTNFDFNDEAGYTVRVESENLSRTGDQSYGIAVKLDDGQPATGQYLLCKYDDGNEKSFGIKLETTGKISWIGSSDGTTVEGITTDSAAFSDGAQSDYVFIMVTYDASESTGVIYVNGVAQATSNLAGGGFGSSIYDTAEVFQIGAEAAPGHYLTGDAPVGLGFGSALTAEEVERITSAELYIKNLAHLLTPSQIMLARTILGETDEDIELAMASVARGKY